MEPVGEKQQTAVVQYLMLMGQRSLNRRRFRLLTTLCLLMCVALVIVANEQSGLAIFGGARDN
ncbi:MAG TPA: hypothetical protein VKR42_03395, partial [Ktedonobacteraceae bacterium]|nr:hypothetical protein [Ktedonobacteraceae bacterium]